MKPSPLEIIAEGQGFVAVNKPAGISVEAHRDHDTVEARAWRHFRRPRSPKQPFVGIVHRLDRPTSGVLLLARNKSTLRRLNRAFEARQISKVYLARTQVPLSGEEGRLEHYLLKDTVQRRATVASPREPKARQARLSYRLVHRGEGGFTYEVRLETGRYHQIRAQFAAAGCPIIGDELYGSPLPYRPSQIMLHAASLTFPDAAGGTLTVTATPPWPC